MKNCANNKRKITSNRFFVMLKAELEFIDVFGFNYTKRAKYDLIMLALDSNKI